jgi:SAM-dependent methyltransferase
VIGLRRTLEPYGERAEILHARGEALPADRGLDLVTSIGVIQFIPEPRPVLEAARRALRPGGRLLIWVYSREGLGLYAWASRVLRVIGTRAPHAVLDGLCTVLNLALDVYIPLCRVLPLPLRDYVTGHLAHLDRGTRKLTIYDQMNPSYTHLYRGPEIEALLRSAGFDAVRLHRRHGYSWTVIATRPDSC